MAAAHPRTFVLTPRRASAPPGPGQGGWLASPLRRGAAVTAVAAAGCIVVLWRLDPARFAALPSAYWMLAVLALVADGRPYTLVGRRATSVILPSSCFTFAMALAWGFGPAFAVQLGTVVVSGARSGQPVRRTVHLVLQHAAALAVVTVMADLADVRLGAGQVQWTDALLAVVAAAGWIAARYGIAALSARWIPAAARWLPATPRHRGSARRGAELLATGALLLLGPVVLAAAQVGLVLVPLVLLAVHAVHRMARATGEQERAARLDPLTGLPNRRALQIAVAAHAAPQAGQADRDGTDPVTPSARYGRALGEPARSGHLALLLLDLDRFRTVNDALGHALGDRLLVAVADRLALAVPSHDLVVRLGGDEFAVLATRVDGPAAARRVADHLAAALDAPFHLDGLPVTVSASIGVALQPAHVGDGATLLCQAEAAMYDAKRRGDDLAFYAPDAGHDPQDRLTLLVDLRRALAAGPHATPAHEGITVYYQPQVDMATGVVTSVEALLRWRHPVRGMVDPEELIRVAEHTAVMRLLTGHVLGEVIGQLGRWRVAGRPVRAAVNVSVRDLHSSDIVDQIDGLLREHDVPAELLQLEITESALMADPHRVLATITRLDRMGVAISLDDFGTGYSSLQHLRRLPISEIKIDRSFVLGMAGDPGDAAIVGSVINLADALGLRVVAEGVEDERTWRLLFAAGCHCAQGWFHARPMPADELTSWLARYRPLRLEHATPSAG